MNLPRNVTFEISELDKGFILRVYHFTLGFGHRFEELAFATEAELKDYINLTLVDQINWHIRRKKP